MRLDRLGAGAVKIELLRGDADRKKGLFYHNIATPRKASFGLLIISEGTALPGGIFVELF